MEPVRGGDTHCVTAVTAVGQAEPSLGLAVASASSSVGSRSDDSGSSAPSCAGGELPDGPRAHETVADATLASGHTEAADPLRGRQQRLRQKRQPKRQRRQRLSPNAASGGGYLLGGRGQEQQRQRQQQGEQRREQLSPPPSEHHGGAPLDGGGDGCTACIDDDATAAAEATPRRARVLILFNGRQRPQMIQKYLLESDADVETFELLDDPINQDLTNERVQALVLARVAGGEFDAVFMAPPCASFCLALQPILRSLADPLGVHTAPRKWRAYLRKHNRLVAFTADVCLAAQRAGAAWMIENPASRRSGNAFWLEMSHRASMWDMPAILALGESTGATPVTAAQCQFESEYQKYTTFLCSRQAAGPAMSEMGWAKCSCKSHAKVAKGYDEFGDSLSAPAAAYPPPLCAALARTLLQAALVAQTERKSVPQAASVEMGSIDPHGLRLDEAQLPRARRAPTFNLSAHAPASEEELRARPLPRFNVPQAAAAIDRSEAVASAPADPPVVRALEDVLQPVWAKRVRTWRRRARRCIKLARLGRWQEARRLRPPDLWVGAAESMRPEALPFDWDLRPLAWGGLAVPVARSSYDGQRPHGTLNLDEVSAAQAESPIADAAIVQDMLDGVSDDVEAERGTFLCAPHSGALQFYAEASSRIQASVDEGWSHVYESIPFWPIRCDPYSVVDESERAGKPKFRLTNDHSWPPLRASDGTLVDDDGKHVRSLNDAMNRSGWPAVRYMRAQQMAEAGAILQASGAPVRAGVLDVVAYYKNFGRQLAELSRNGSLTEEGFVIDERCCFGSAADAVKCSRASNFFVHHARRAMAEVDANYPPCDPQVLEWLEMRRRLGAEAGASSAEITEIWACLHAVGMYVDDASTMSIDDLLFDQRGTPLMSDGVHVRRADAHFAAVRATFERFGLSTAKEQLPCTSVVLLGIQIDLESGRLTLSDEKRAKYALRAEAMAVRSTCPRVEYLELMGRLTFAATCYPRGRQWLHAPWRAARARYRTADGSVVLSSAVRRALRRWVTELRSDVHDGVPLASSTRFPAASSTEAMVIYADAAGESAGAGFCAWTVADGELLYVEGRWTPEEKRELLICDLELAASTFGLVALQHAVRRKYVYSFTDNTVAMAAMRNLTPTTEAMQALTAARTAWMLESNVAEATERVTSKANLWADLGSRARVGDMLDQAQRLGLAPRRLHVPDDWRSMVGDAAAAAAAAKTGEGQRDQTVSQRAGAVLTIAPPIPLVSSCVHQGSPAGTSTGDAAGADVDRARIAAHAVPQLRSERSSGRHTLDGREMVAQVLRVRQVGEPGDAADGAVSSRAEAGGRAAADGLCHLAGDVQPLGQASERQVDRQVRVGGARLALEDAEHAPHGRPGLRPGSQPASRHLARDRAACSAAALGRANPGPGEGDRRAPVGANGGGVDVVGRPLDGILRASARRGVLDAGRRDLQPAHPPDARRRQVPDGRRRQGVHGAHDAAGQAEAWRGQERAAAVCGGGLAPQPGAGDQAHARARPSAGRAACYDPSLPPQDVGDQGDGGASDGEVADGDARPRSVEVRRPLAAHWRGDGGARSEHEPGDDPRGRQVVERHLRDLLPDLAAVGGERDLADRLDALRGPRTWSDVRRRGAHSYRGRDARVVDRDLLRAGHDRRPLRRRRPILNPRVKMDSTTTTSSRGTQPAGENAHRVHAGSVGRGHSWGRRAVALQATARRGSESSRRTPEEAAGGGVRSSRREPEEAAERYRSIGAQHRGEHRSGKRVTWSEEYDDGQSARGAQAWHGEETEGAQRHGDLPTATRRSRRANDRVTERLEGIGASRAAVVVGADVKHVRPARGRRHCS